jgi:hypothetical protein
MHAMISYALPNALIEYDVRNILILFFSAGDNVLNLLLERPKKLGRSS